MAGTQVKLICSIGIATITDTSPDAEELTARAKTAADHVASGKRKSSGALLYVPDRGHDEQDNTKAIEALKKAVDNEQFKLLYQPIVPLSYNSKMSHYEALLRLLDQKKNELAPSLFLNTITLADLSTRMDRWVIKQSVLQLRSELDKGHKHRLFISVTAQTWRDPDMLVWLADLLREQRMPADHLVFQISEHECSSNLSAAQSFADGLKKLHCLICIKHHGSSSNAKQVLRQLPADYVKLDGSFINELIDADPLDESFNEMIEGLKTAGKITIAPQVENPKVMSRLWKSGVGLIQGYYLQPPVDKMDYDFFDN